MNEKEVRDCFANALKDESKGQKHKGLLITKPDDKTAKEYLTKAKVNLQLCDLYKEQGFDYKIPEEWFYTLYYCALAILAKFGIESRSQKCTASFLRYAKDNGLIDYDDEFIDTSKMLFVHAVCFNSQKAKAFLGCSKTQTRSVALAQSF